MKRETTLDNGQTNFHSLHLTTDFMYKLGCASETSSEVGAHHAKIGWMCSNLFQVVVYFTSTYTLEIKNNYHSTKPERPVQMTHFA